MQLQQRVRRKLSNRHLLPQMACTKQISVSRFSCEGDGGHNSGGSHWEHGRCLRLLHVQPAILCWSFWGAGTGVEDTQSAWPQNNVNSKPSGRNSARRGDSLCQKDDWGIQLSPRQSQVVVDFEHWNLQKSNCLRRLRDCHGHSLDMKVLSFNDSILLKLSAL